LQNIFQISWNINKLKILVKSREIPEIPLSQLQETVQYNLRKLKMVEEELDEEYRDDSLFEETSTQENVEAAQIIIWQITG